MKGKVVLIVGGTGGIGEATARLMATHGAKVVIAGRNTQKADEIAQSIKSDGGEAIALTVNVTDPKSVEHLAKHTVEQMGKIDVLVNSFGQGLIKPFNDITTAEAKEILDVNVFGTFLVTQTVLKYMHSEAPTNVVMFPGTMGKYVMRNSSVYSASKFAIQGLTKALTEELKRDNVRFSLLYLGGVNTQFWDNERVAMRVKKESMLSAKDVARTILSTVAMPVPGVVNEIVLQPESHQLV